MKNFFLLNTTMNYFLSHILYYYKFSSFNLKENKDSLEGGKALRSVNLLPTRDEPDVKCHQWPGTMCTLRPERHIVGCNFN